MAAPATLAAIALIVLWLFAVRKGHGNLSTRWRVSEDLPKTLQSSALWASEKFFQCRSPVKLHGTVDQVYQLENGLLVPIETKTRTLTRVYHSDRLQLSLQAFLLRRARPWWIAMLLGPLKVADYGYVRCVSPTGVHYLHVDLLTDVQVLFAYQRYCDLLSHKIAPSPARSFGACARCAYRDMCPHQLSSKTSGAVASHER